MPRRLAKTFQKVANTPEKGKHLDCSSMNREGYLLKLLPATLHLPQKVHVCTHICGYRSPSVQKLKCFSHTSIRDSVVPVQSRFFLHLAGGHMSSRFAQVRSSLGSLLENILFALTAPASAQEASGAFLLCLPHWTVASS